MPGPLSMIPIEIEPFSVDVLIVKSPDPEFIVLIASTLLRARFRMTCWTGADADAADDYGTTPLHLAARYDHEPVVKELLARGVDVNRANDFGSLPLHEAAFANRTSLINLLLGSGADTSARNGNGESPIDLASAEGNSVAVLIMRSSSVPGRNTVRPSGIQ